ncbi:MAG: DUF3048 domain-containing protein [bacterium]
MPEEEQVIQSKLKKYFQRKPVIITLVVVLLAAVALTGYLITQSSGDSANKNTANSGQSDQTLVRRLIDGVLDHPNNENLHPVAVMIENLSSIRPQGGLDQASIVYEALVEGGITRFMAVFAMTDQIENIGPVRSARPYYVDWANELGAMYVHVGGSPQALGDIRSKDVFDFDQFYNQQYFWRKDLPRAREHNLFTASKFLIFALRDKEAPQEGSFTPWKFKDEAPLSERPSGIDPIVINYSSQSYQVVYQYDRENNVYLRFQADDPHVILDKTNVQISPKNVVVQYVKTSLADASRLAMETVGSGQAIIFLDGQAIEATWEKDSTSKRTIFSDSAGKEIVFNAGQTWVQVVPTDREVTY